MADSATTEASETALVHAKTFETRWGLGLAYLDMDDSDVECLKLQLWQPVGEGRGIGKVALKVGLDATASDAAHEAMWEANCSALAKMTAETFEATFAAAGVADMLDELHAR